MASKLRTAVIPFVLAILSACSSGGGGSTDGQFFCCENESFDGFTSFSAIRANQSVAIQGLAVTASGNQQTIDGDTTITSANLNPNPTDRPNDPAIVDFSYDGSRALKALRISTPHSTVSFDRDTPGHSLSCSGNGTCTAENPTASALVIDALAVGWNYQSFGVWSVESTPSSWLVGAMTAGRRTDDSLLPTTGTAVFTGLAGGFYSDSVGTPYATTASMSANVNFSTRNIQFSTSNTTRVNANTGVQTPDNGLNLSGSFSYIPRVNPPGGATPDDRVGLFRGPLVTQNGVLAGQGSGQFYGPAAEEIGGVYSLSGTGLSRMVGAFGGKR
jgi:hypothetical protein